MNTLNLPHPTEARHAVPPAGERPEGMRPSPLLSEVLLQGRKLVEIQHNGELYRLQATRHGKLILTK